MCRSSSFFLCFKFKGLVWLRISDQENYSPAVTFKPLALYYSQHANFRLLALRCCFVFFYYFIFPLHFFFFFPFSFVCFFPSVFLLLPTTQKKENNKKKIIGSLVMQDIKKKKKNLYFLSIKR